MPKTVEKKLFKRHHNQVYCRDLPKKHQLIDLGVGGGRKAFGQTSALVKKLCLVNNKKKGDAIQQI